jgi:hypothetical protein
LGSEACCRGRFQECWREATDCEKGRSKKIPSKKSKAPATAKKTVREAPEAKG